MSRPLVVVGSINMDLVVAATRIPAVGETLLGHSFETYHGGKGANQAVAAARLGATVQMVGAVGDDAFGRQLRAGLVDAGVDASMVESVAGASGVAAITTGEQGENSIVVVPGANGKFTPARLETLAPRLAKAAMLLSQLEISIECIDWLAVFAERHDIPLMLDPAPACAIPSSILRRVAWLTPNESEAKTLVGTGHGGEAATRLLETGARNVVLKLGSAGCIVARRMAPEIRIAATPVRAIDTTAAGDAFNGGLAVALTSGRDVEAAARFANRVAALSVTKRGAQPSMPSAQDVEQFAAKAAAGAA